jgi:hypothetical protein
LEIHLPQKNAQIAKTPTSNSFTTKNTPEPKAKEAGAVRDGSEAAKIHKRTSFTDR